MSDGFYTGGWTCSDGGGQAINGWHCDPGDKITLPPPGIPMFAGTRHCALYEVSDTDRLTYPVVCPVLPRDLAVFRNGARLFDGIDYSFRQLSNSITLFSRPQINDLLDLRVIVDK